MVEGLIGKKLGMTQIFDDQGNSVPVTVIQAGPCVVVEKKTLEKHGYTSVQLGFVETSARCVSTSRPTGTSRRPTCRPRGCFGNSASRKGGDRSEHRRPDLLVEKCFRVGDLVDVSGQSIGKGFQGVIKRHHFRGGASPHGSMFHRAPGSIGASAWPSRVLPGMRAAGHMGNEKVKVRQPAGRPDRPARTGCCSSRAPFPVIPGTVTFTFDVAK